MVPTKITEKKSSSKQNLQKLCIPVRNSYLEEKMEQRAMQLAAEKKEAMNKNTIDIQKTAESTVPTSDTGSSNVAHKR